MGHSCRMREETRGGYSRENEHGLFLCVIYDSSSFPFKVKTCCHGRTPQLGVFYLFIYYCYYCYYYYYYFFFLFIFFLLFFFLSSDHWVASVLVNDAFNTFHQLYDVGHMVKHNEERRIIYFI